MNEKPLVSVLMTAYNRERYIAEAIESVLASTYRNFELIIVDDASSDETVNIAKGFALTDSRIKMYVNDHNLGDYPNRNTAAGYAQGKFILYVDSDDTLFPNTIQQFLEIIRPLKNFNFAMYWEHSNETFVLEGNEAMQRHFYGLQFLYMGPGGTIIRRSFFEKIGGYPEKYGPANDMYFNLKVCCNTSILLIPFELIYYRRHEGQEVNNRFSYMYNNYMYMRDALEELPLPFTGKQLHWLKKKNKRRFVVHLFHFFRKSFDFKKTRYAYTKAAFSFKDVLQGVFH